MGNSGSIHNLNIEGATSELNSYFQAQSQPLRKSGNRELGYNFGHKNATSLLRTQPPRHSKDWRRSLANPCDLKEYNVGQDYPTQFKVLPKVNERLHLRATTNGAILFSGGTISGRKEDRVQTNKSPSMPAVAGMQRSRTFIYEPTKDSNDTEADKCRPHEFNRSQTLLNIKVKADKAYLSANKGNNLKSMQKHTHSEPDFGHTSNKDENNAALSKNGKVNKYNKKRRAPQAPTTDASPSLIPTGEKSEASTRVHITQNPQKQQLFTKNNHRNKTNVVVNEPNEVHVQAHRSHEKKPMPPPPQSTAVFERTEALRTTLQTKIPYRREKSSDAILLKSQNDKLNFVESKHEAKLTTTPEPTRITKHLEQRKSLDNYKSENLNESAEKTKIPQLKRTFYFGMDSSIAKTKHRTPAQTPEQRSVQKKPENNRITSALAPTNFQCNDDDDASASMPYIPNYDINIDKSDTPEDINDNGLMVHIRPTLPRRQFDTPTFNPVVAWRSLVEDQENLQRRTIKISATNKFNDKKDGQGQTTGGKIDSPIQPKRMTKVQSLVEPSMLLNTWTPEQDLGDEDDENEAAVIVGEESSSDDCQSEIDGNGLLFYGSKMKKSEQYPKQIESPVHLFSLSLPRDTHLDGIPAEKTFNYSSLQKMDKIGYSAKRVGQQTPAGLRKTEMGYEFGRLSGTNFDGSNNWLLHKNIADAANTAKTHTKAVDGNDRSSYPSIEPMSLKFLTAGKHVMYLPCNYDKAEQTEAPKHGTAKDVPAQPSSQQRQSKRRQRELRENLQDPTPVFPANQNALNSASADNDKPLHQRFTFQSTMRLLEKRRMAEKLSKDAEIKEAQRKSELVALERVEEDFQRKRANEKANIRYQLRLYFGGNNEECKERYQSLPITNSQTINDYSNRQLNDTNNNYNDNSNICCRDEPDGCVSTPQLGSSDNELGSKSSYARK